MTSIDSRLQSLHERDRQAVTAAVVAGTPFLLPILLWTFLPERLRLQTIFEWSLIVLFLTGPVLGFAVLSRLAPSVKPFRNGVVGATVALLPLPVLFWGVPGFAASVAQSPMVNALIDPMGWMSPWRRAVLLTTIGTIAGIAVLWLIPFVAALVAIRWHRTS